MIKTIAELTNAFKSVIPESFYKKNTKREVVYPYLTYSYTLEPLRQNAKGMYLDVNIFDDQGNNNERIEQAVGDLIDFVDDKSNLIFTDDLIIQFDSIQINDIPTGSDVLQRRAGQIYIRVDWRKK